MATGNYSLKCMIAIAAISVALVLLLIISMRLRVPTPDYAVHVEQVAQLRSIQQAIESFATKFGQFPPSEANDPIGKPYDGAMKLCEALMGQDLLGFHIHSFFRSDGMDLTGTIQLYSTASTGASRDLRIGPFLNASDARVRDIAQICAAAHTRPHAISGLVLTDTYVHKREGGTKCGMPVLYYRAKQPYVLSDGNDPMPLFNCSDNHHLLALGVPGGSTHTHTHPLFTDPNLLYNIIQRAHLDVAHSETYAYILISAGPDGLYGTTDDICLLGSKH